MHPDQSNQPSLEPEIIARQKAERAVKRQRINDDVAKQLREPFQKILVDMLDGAPSIESWEALARNAPQKWASALSRVGELAGYNREVAVTNVNVVHVSQLPDSTLHMRLQLAERKLAELQVARGLLPLSPTPNVPRETMQRTKADDDRTVDVDAHEVPRETIAPSPHLDGRADDAKPQP